MNFKIGPALDFFSSNVNRYEGEYFENNNHTPHGSGICYYGNGIIFEGEWKNGIPNGKGIVILTNGEVYGGEWANGELIEKTQKIFINGNHYFGEFKDGFPDGEGRMKKYDGKIFDGKFKKGKFISVILTLSDGKEHTVLDPQPQLTTFNLFEGGDKKLTQFPENWKRRHEQWVKEKFLDPEIYAPEEKNLTTHKRKYSDEEIIYLAELNPGFGFRRFVGKLYPHNRGLKDNKNTYYFTILFSDYNDAFGVDLLNLLEDKKYHKLVNGDAYLKVTGEKNLPYGYKGKSPWKCMVPMKPQTFEWGDIIPGSERRRYKKNNG